MLANGIESRTNVSQNRTASVVVLHSDIHNLIVGKECSRLEVRLRTELLGLKRK
jgi:hypothetical protein